MQQEARSIPVVIDGRTQTVVNNDQKMAGGGLEGAEKLSREMLSWQPAIISPDQQIAADKEMADARTSDAVQNIGMMRGASATHKDSIVGAVYRLNAKPNVEALLGYGATDEWADEFQVAVESRFNLIADSPNNWLDASRMNTLTSMVRLAIGVYFVHGEVLATAEWIKDPRRPCRTAIQMVSPFRLSNPQGEADNATLRSGVRIDPTYGAPLGYYIKSTYPGEIFNMENAWIWKYVPATKPWGRKQVIHILEQMNPSQSRGISEMVSVLKDMRMTKRFSEITLQNAVVNASYAAVVESDLPSDMIYASMGAGQSLDGATPMAGMLGEYLTAMNSYLASAKNIAVDGVKMPHLFPGTKLNLKPMGTPGGVGTEFEASLLRHIATGLGLSYEQLSRDYSQTNYSSARATMAETWKFMMSRKKMVADRFATEVYTLWLEEEIQAGTLPLPGNMTPDEFYKPIVKEAISACDWIGASRGQIDEGKETDAAIKRMNSNLSTLEMESARLGTDWRDNLKQIAREQKMRKRLGIDPPPADPSKPAAQTATDEQDKQKEDEQ